MIESWANTDGYIFISYARSDGSDFAMRLHNDLESTGFNAWLDKFDIRAGYDFDAEIDSGIQQARAVVVLLTPGSVLSLQVKSEWNAAINRWLPVFPLLVTNCEVPRVLNVLNLIDFRDNYHKAFSQLTARLNSIEVDHLEHLKDLLRGFEEAQRNTDSPSRFEHKIQELREAIKAWDEDTDLKHQRVYDQRARIVSELNNEKLKYIDAAKRRHREKRQRIVGQRLIDVSEYFRDRHRQLQEVSQLLADSRTRVISVIGRGGMGKTALVSRVLSELEDLDGAISQEYGDILGIIYLSTRTRGISLERLFVDCARALGGERERQMISVWTSAELSTEEKINRLLAELVDGLYIILLDNMEDLLDDSQQIRDKEMRMFFELSLMNPHNVRLLLTSRIPINFRREVMRFDRRIFLEEGLPIQDAVEMLRDLDPDNQYGVGNAPQELLERAATLVHGVPRALEVIVSILAHDPFLTVEELLDRGRLFHEDEFVENLVKESYKHVDPQERRIMEALAIYARPVPTIAVDYLLEPFEKGLEAQTILRRLVQTHAVTVDRHTKMVSLHPIDQDYIFSQIPENIK